MAVGSHDPNIDEAIGSLIGSAQKARDALLLALAQRQYQILGDALVLFESITTALGAIIESTEGGDGNDSGGDVPGGA